MVAVIIIFPSLWYLAILVGFILGKDAAMRQTPPHIIFLLGDDLVGGFYIFELVVLKFV